MFVVLMLLLCPVCFGNAMPSFQNIQIYGFNSFTAGIEFTRQILTSKLDPRTERIKIFIITFIITLVFKWSGKSWLRHKFTMISNWNNPCFVAQKYLCKIQKLQNRAARLLAQNFDWNIRGIDIVRGLGWQNVKERYCFLSCCLIYK